MVGNQACFSFYSPVVVDAPPSHGKYSDFRLRNAVGTTARNISERRRCSTLLLLSDAPQGFRRCKSSHGKYSDFRLRNAVGTTARNISERRRCSTLLLLSDAPQGFRRCKSSHGKYSDFRLRNAVGTTARNISERRRCSARLLFSGHRRDSEPPRAPTYILNQKIKALACHVSFRTRGGVHHRKKYDTKENRPPLVVVSRGCFSLSPHLQGF